MQFCVIFFLDSNLMADTFLYFRHCILKCFFFIFFLLCNNLTLFFNLILNCYWKDPLNLWPWEKWYYLRAFFLICTPYLNHVSSMVVVLNLLESRAPHLIQPKKICAKKCMPMKDFFREGLDLDLDVSTIHYPFQFSYHDVILLGSLTNKQVHVKCMVVFKV